MKLVKTFFVICLLGIIAIPVLAQNGQRARKARQGSCANCPLAQTAFAAQPLSSEEAAQLLFMREEEKLARDVYQALNEKWGVQVFARIAVSEQRHFDAIGTLIKRYELTDPAQESAGSFTNPDLQKFYDDLMARGNESLLEALKVGVEIEETDIDDLKAAIAATDHKDLLTVYTNLLNGSLNHFSAFNNNVEILGSN